MPTDRRLSFVSKRWHVIVASVLTTAVVSVLAAFALYLLASKAGANGDDSSSRQTVPSEVLLVTSIFGSAAIVVVLPIALVLLRPTQLRRTVPIVALITVALTALASVGDPLFGLLTGVAGGVLAMIVAALLPGLREPVLERRRLGAPL
jgi:hypothetical protein